MHGADPRILDHQSRSPVDVALKLPHSNLQIEILEYMAEPSFFREYCSRGHRMSLRKEHKSYSLVIIQSVLLAYSHLICHLLLLSNILLPVWLI